MIEPATVQGPSPEASADRRSRPSAFLAIGSVVFIAAAVIGAYLDWLWWPVYDGITITIAAAGLLLAGGIAWLAGRLLGPRLPRRVGILVIAIGIGLVIGQTVGPSRETLIMSGGTMTLRLERPFAASATGSATCSNGASQTEFAVGGDPNMRLDTPDQPFVTVSFDVGDRWSAIRDTPRKNGVRLEISSTSPLVTAAGKPSTLGMQATAASTLASTFTNSGGSIRFAGLSPEDGPDFNGAVADFAGTVTWSCVNALQ